MDQRGNQKEILNYFEFNEYENTTYPNLQDTAKLLLKGKL